MDCRSKNNRIFAALLRQPILTIPEGRGFPASPFVFVTTLLLDSVTTHILYYVSMFYIDSTQNSAFCKYHNNKSKKMFLESSKVNYIKGVPKVWNLYKLTLIDF